MNNKTTCYILLFMIFAVTIGFVFLLRSLPLSPVIERWTELIVGLVALIACAKVIKDNLWVNKK